MCRKSTDFVLATGNRVRNRCRFWLLALGIALPAASPAQPATSPYDGVRLINDCQAAVRVLDNAKTTNKPEEAVAATQCSYFAWGVYLAQRRSISTTDGKRLFCAPANAKQEQVVRVLAKWLEGHPELLHQPADKLVGSALRDTFPCPQKSSRQVEQDT